MSASTIEWTDATWNPTTGCDRISPGCDHCYALALAARLKRMGQARYQRDGDPRTSGPGFGLTLHPDKLSEPLRWRKPRMVFVNSMSDLFHKDVPPTFVEQIWETMAEAQQHTFQVLTKRPKRMRAIVTELERRFGVLPNVWLGTSIELASYSWRAHHLRATPAAVRFISAEPLLGDVFLGLDLTGIDWLIVGGESGPDHRPIDPQWVRRLRNACLAEHWQRHPNGDHPEDRPAFFFKQWGGRTPKAGGRELDGRTWDELPRQILGGAA